MILKKSKLFSIIMSMITVLSLLSLMIPDKVIADSNDKSITLVCVSGNTVLSGMKWKLYKIGKRTSNGRNFTQTGDFSSVQVNLRKLTEERVNEAAQTFQSYAVANRFAPLREGETNEYGEIEFTGLDAGLYLICGKILRIGTHYYVPTTALVEIKEDDANLRYNAYPKFEYEVANEMPRRYTAYKKWQGDEEHLDERPKQVVFEIFKDEEYYDSVILNDENNWQYTWIDYKGVSSWIVMENDIPPHYEMKITYDASRYVIENSYTEEPFTTTTKSGATVTSTTTTAVSGSADDWYGSKTRTTATVPVGNVTVTTVTTNSSADDWYGSKTRTTATVPVDNLTVTRTGTNTTVSSVDNLSVTRTGTTTTAPVSGESSMHSGTTGSTTVPSGEALITKATETSTERTTSEGRTSSTGRVTSRTTTTTRPKNGGGGGSGSGGGGKLPQTGQLWWPVVPLSISGILLISAGFTIKAKKKSDG